MGVPGLNIPNMLTTFSKKVNARQVK